LNDASVSLQRETRYEKKTDLSIFAFFKIILLKLKFIIISMALGQGWRIGFLGTLHMDVFRQRLEEVYKNHISKEFFFFKIDILK